MTVLFIGGPVDRARTDLTRTPAFVIVRDVRYERVDDPDTGKPLGCYVAAHLDPILVNGVNTSR